MEKKPLTSYAILSELEREEVSSLYLFLEEEWGRQEITRRIKNLLFKDPALQSLILGQSIQMKQAYWLSDV